MVADAPIKLLPDVADTALELKNCASRDLTDVVPRLTFVAPAVIVEEAVVNPNWPRIGEVRPIFVPLAPDDTRLPPDSCTVNALIDVVAETITFVPLADDCDSVAPDKVKRQLVIVPLDVRAMLLLPPRTVIAPNADTCTLEMLVATQLIVLVPLVTRVFVSDARNVTEDHVPVDTSRKFAPEVVTRDPPRILKLDDDNPANFQFPRPAVKVVVDVTTKAAEDSAPLNKKLYAVAENDAAANEKVGLLSTPSITTADPPHVI